MSSALPISYEYFVFVLGSPEVTLPLSFCLQFSLFLWRPREALVRIICQEYVMVGFPKLPYVQ